MLHFFIVHVKQESIISDTYKFLDSSFRVNDNVLRVCHDWPFYSLTCFANDLGLKFFLVHFINRWPCTKSEKVLSCYSRKSRDLVF